MKSILKTSGGRILLCAMGFALFGGGISCALTGDAALYVMQAALFLPIAVSIYGVAVAIAELPGYTALFLIAAPQLLFAYAIGLAASMKYMPSMGILYGAVGLGAILLAARPPVAERHHELSAGEDRAGSRERA